MPNGESASATERREFLKAGSSVVAGAALVGASAVAVGGKVFAQGGKGKAKWGFVIDLRACTGCEACVVACKTENCVALGRFRTGVKFYEHGSFPKTKRSMVPWLCNQCDKPVCIENCPADKVKKPWGAEVAATYKRPDGIVVVDQDRCVGCGACVEDCPYGVRFIDPFTKAGGDPDQNAASKCDLCLHRVLGGVVPSCVNTCPGDARKIVDLDNPNDPGNKLIKANRSIVKTLMSEKRTDPQCFYIDPDGMLGDAYRKSPDEKTKMNKETI